MMRPRSLPTLIAGCALVVIVNVAILGTAAWNRGGDRPANMTLTERELALPEFRDAESSGCELTLKFASNPPQSVFRAMLLRRNAMPAVAYPWLDKTKLEALGFRLPAATSAALNEHGNESPGSRAAFIALEFDGASWEPWLAAREEALRKKLSEEDASALLALDRTMRSRLVPVDAATDEAELRGRYPDRARTLIVQAIVRAERDGTEWRGRIPNLVMSDIRVPRELVPSLERFLPKETEREVMERGRGSNRVSWPDPRPPRYRAVVAFGRRNEPWLVSVSEIAAE